MFASDFASGRLVRYTAQIIETGMGIFFVFLLVFMAIFEVEIVVVFVVVVVVKYSGVMEKSERGTLHEAVKVFFVVFVWERLLMKMTDEEEEWSVESEVKFKAEISGCLWRVYDRKRARRERKKKKFMMSIGVSSQHY